MWWVVLAFVACTKEAPTPTPNHDGSGSKKPAPIEIGSSVALPEVARDGYEPAVEGLAVVITKTGIVVEGKAIVSIQNGAVDPSEKEGGTLGVLIPRLRAFTEQLVQQPSARGKPILIVADRDTPYRTLLEVVYSMKQAGPRAFSIIARSKGDIVALPLTERERTVEAASPPESAGSARSADAPLGMFVSITRRGIQVWSVSGREGTIGAPRRTIELNDPARLDAAVGELRRELADVAAKHTAPEDRQIVIQAEMGTPLQVFAAVAGAAHASFPAITLSSGFE